MPGSTIDDLLRRLHELQHELESEIDALLREKRAQFNYTLERGKVRFEEGIKALQRHQKTGLWRYLKDAPLGHVLSAPIVYSLLIPFVLLDILVSFYQQVCFRIYQIPLVSRKEHIVIDRHHLAYLNLVEKINCVYCSYGIGVISYVREIAARTEQYWCPIKHARRTVDPHRLELQFVDYGDAENYQSRLQELRKEITSLRQD